MIIIKCAEIFRLITQLQLNRSTFPDRFSVLKCVIYTLESFQSLISINSQSFKKVVRVPLHKIMKFFMTDFFDKCNQIRRKLTICSHLLEKSVMENFIFVQCIQMYSCGILKQLLFYPHRVNFPFCLNNFVILE